MGWYDDHEPGDALFAMLLFFYGVAIVAGIMVFILK